MTHLQPQLRPAPGRSRVAHALGGRWTTGILLAFFALQASFLAVLFRQSIYDESYHLRAIDFFSRQWTPFVDQSADVGGVGDLERYGSYLYHYLMAVPWRLTSGLADDHRLIVLRLITVGIVVGALAVAHGLARDLGLSPVAANVVLFLLAATPLLVFVGATVNYDNLLLLFVLLMMRAAVRLLTAPRLDPGGWLRLLTWASLAAVTKYVALPLIAVIGLAVLLRQFLVFRRTRGIPGPGQTTPWYRRPRRVLAVAATVVSVGLFAERYLVNVLRFRSLQPDCAVIHSASSCATFAPWQRNAELDAAFADLPIGIGTLTDYIGHSWIPLMLRYTTLYGVIGTDGEPLNSLGPNIGGSVVVVLTIAVLVLLVLGAARILRDWRAATLLLACAGYLGALFAENYTAYLALGQPLGIQGRYLLPVLPVVFALAVGTAHRILVADGAAGRRVGWAALAALLLATTQGGGVIGPVAGSDRTWLRETGGAGVYDVLHDLTQGIVVPDHLVPDPRRPGT
ncbi:DUF2142 domain-containing protein [Cellulomonas denverensis]|uniref:DUF2142 domain-containing protein n=1 Tax=Cellulomonas denverensis TaxID=264297 RepID=A0A7X6QYW8_9CELL|nr:DUF2142 domain-containing protein [Cellulomonas denverensis]NKY22507.1 DUF2142 domain-containing protein [Cellulomonas denverensis]GIG25981.1 hypothetical protein Cde04nite_22250 [Cellulomonas denverensis]